MDKSNDGGGIFIYCYLRSAKDTFKEAEFACQQHFNHEHEAGLLTSAGVGHHEIKTGWKMKVEPKVFIQIACILD